MFTDFDKSIYKILKYIDSNYSIDNLISKFGNQNDSNYLNFLIEQMVNESLVDGVHVNSGKVENTKFVTHSKNIYITQKGYSFMKAYKWRKWPLIRTILIIAITAIITVYINNWFAIKTDCTTITFEQGNAKK